MPAARTRASGSAGAGRPGLALVRAQSSRSGAGRPSLSPTDVNSLCRLATTDFAVGSAAEVLELAYAMRWLELAPDSLAEDAIDDLPIEVVDD